MGRLAAFFFPPVPGSLQTAPMDPDPELVLQPLEQGANRQPSFGGLELVQEAQGWLAEFVGALRSPFVRN